MSNLEFEIRSYRPGDEIGILKSFNTVFREVCGAGYVDRDLATWHWQFRDNPLGHRISVAIAPDGTVAAHYAALPVAVTTSRGDGIWVQGVDSFTHPDYRQGLKRPGLFVQTAKHCLDACRDRHESWYGYPVIAAERIGKRFLGYERVCVVDYLVRDPGLPLERPAGVEVESTRVVPSEIDALFARVLGREHCLLRRDAAYLQWRYLAAPGAPYEMLAARRGGELTGLAVIRTRHELVPGACTIADWVVPPTDTDTAAALVAVMRELALQHDRQRLLAVFAANSAEHATLRALGFAVEPSAHYMERPLIIGLADPRLDVPWLADHWWYVLGDTDLV